MKTVRHSFFAVVLLFSAVAHATDTQTIEQENPSAINSVTTETSQVVEQKKSNVVINVVSSDTPQAADQKKSNAVVNLVKRVGGLGVAVLTSPLRLSGWVADKVFITKGFEWFGNRGLWKNKSFGRFFVNNKDRLGQLTVLSAVIGGVYYVYNKVNKEEEETKAFDFAAFFEEDEFEDDEEVAPEGQAE